MKILVTGGAGYIGSHTVVELLNNDFEVVVVDNFSNSCKKVIERIKYITKKDFAFYEMDCCKYIDMKNVFLEHKIDAIIHFAGYKAVGESVKEPLKYYENNICSTLTLLNLCSIFSVDKFVFSSSATVYGTPDVVPIKEDAKVGNTANPYGTTKYMNELILKDYANAHPNFSLALLRYFNPIGAHKSGLIGENPKGIPNNLMPYITQVAIGKREILSVFGNDYDTKDGTGVRDYIHVCDLARGHVLALDKIKNNTGTYIYNLGTGIGYSVLDLVDTMSKVVGFKIPYQISPRRPGDIAICYADPTKALVELNFKTIYNLEDMCKDSWNWQQNNPNGYEE